VKPDQFLFIDKCPVCGSEDFGHHLSTTDYFLTGEEFDLEKCCNCGLIFTNPIIKPEHIGAYYASDKYYSHPVKSFSPVKLLYDLIKHKNVKSKLSIIHGFSEAGNILDIGCGSGHFLQYAKKRGWKIFGLEPNTSAREYASRLTGVEIKKPEEAKLLPKQGFDVITLWHVLEHIMNLEEQLKLICNLIRNDGYVFVALPNHESPDALKYGKYWAAWDVPRHLYHFNKATVQFLFAKHNFELSNVFPMYWDAYYVSLLSEKYAGNKIPHMRAILAGYRSNRSARPQNNYSSLIYCFKQKMT
jgi:2-polyprenyl-3-methyl-5-hydroxy-6-metoxy-1,4-benzoquinol methylase